MTYQFLSGFHIGTAISALVFGLCVFLTRKGTRLHKQFGYAYFFNMLGLNVSALFIYRLTGNFGPFHGAALASLLTLIAVIVIAVTINGSPTKQGKHDELAGGTQVVKG